MLRPAISWRTLAVLDFIRVPPPAASTITVRSLDMGSNLTAAGPGGRIVLRTDLVPRTCRVDVLPRSAGPTPSAFPGGSAGPACCPARRALRFLHSPVGLPGLRAAPPGGPYAFCIPRLVCRQGPPD